MLMNMRRKVNPQALLVGMLIGAVAMKTVWMFLKELKIKNYDRIHYFHFWLFFQARQKH